MFLGFNPFCKLNPSIQNDLILSKSPTFLAELTFAGQHFILRWARKAEILKLHLLGWRAAAIIVEVIRFT